eukprot:8606938-Pyramimonas_sp.AAC.1
MTLSSPSVFVVICANHPSPNWAARKPVMYRDIEAMVFAMPKFALDAFGKITSISRVSPLWVVVV